jgi:hypothetical protein
MLIDLCSNFLCPFDCDMSFFPCLSTFRFCGLASVLNHRDPFSAYCSAFTLVGFFVTCIYPHRRDEPLRANPPWTLQTIFICMQRFFFPIHCQDFPYLDGVRVTLDTTCIPICLFPVATLSVPFCQFLGPDPHRFGSSYK